jgi:surface polysaccharide O-acyltransferase-like enzyme
VAALALRSVWPVGVNVWGLQMGYFASYVLLFAFGCMAASAHWLERLPQARVRTWWRISLITLPMLAILYFLGLAVPELRGRVLQVAYAFWEPLVAWGICLKLLQSFQRRFTTLNDLWRALARRAYAIFIVHPPVVVAVALAWREVPANPLLKFVVTGSISCVLCFVLAGWLLRLPGLRRVL